jgi:thymidylate synthase (FAD)
MKEIQPKIEVLTKLDQEQILKDIELYGRTCYKSEGKVGPGTSYTFAKRIISNGHHSVLEHVSISVRIYCDRGVSHELVRHRLAAYSQESTRYCRYGDGEVCFVSPFDKDDQPYYNMWKTAMIMAEQNYLQMLSLGVAPQIARSVLPNSLKTELVMTANIREWRHILTLRTSNAAHPQMRQIASMILDKFQSALPVLFNDIGRE